MPEAEFLRVLSDATSNGTLKDLYRKIHAERTHRELQWREDEDNTEARNAYARSVMRRMQVFLSLPVRVEARGKAQPGYDMGASPRLDYIESVEPVGQPFGFERAYELFEEDKRVLDTLVEGR